MYFVELNLKGFMGHYDSCIPLSEGLTVITGLNDSGKSSILHALRWILTESLTGDNFMFHLKDQNGETIQKVSQTSVELVRSDGLRIEKYRKGRETGFILTNPESEEQNTFVTAKTPEEILNALNIKPVYRFGDHEFDLNFLYQHDSPFLMAEAPSVGAVVMGTLSGTQALDIAAGDTEREARVAKKEQARLRTEINTINTQLLDFEWIPETQKLLEEYENKSIETDNIDNDLDRLYSINLKYKRSFEIEKEAFIKSGKLSSVLDIVSYSFHESEKFYSNFIKLNSLFEKTIRYRKQLNICVNKESLLINLPDLQTVLNSTENILNKINKLEKLSMDLNLIKSRFSKSNAKLEKLKDLDNLKLTTQKPSDLTVLTMLSQKYRTLFQAKLSAEKKVFQLEKLAELKPETVSDLLESHSKISVLLSKFVFFSKKSFNLHEKLIKFRELESFYNYFSNIVNSLEVFKKFNFIATSLHLVSEKIIKFEKSMDFIEKSISYENINLKNLWDSVGGVCPTCEKPQGDCND